MLGVGGTLERASWSELRVRLGALGLVRATVGVLPGCGCIAAEFADGNVVGMGCSDVLGLIAGDGPGERVEHVGTCVELDQGERMEHFGTCVEIVVGVWFG